MGWSIHNIFGQKYVDHWQPTQCEELELIVEGHQPFRMRLDKERGVVVVYMQALAYSDAVNGQYPFPLVVEDWKEVTTIPLAVAVRRPTGRKFYHVHWEGLFGFYQRGSNAYPDVRPRDDAQQPRNNRLPD